MVDDTPLQSWVLVVAVLESKFPVHPQEGGGRGKVCSLLKVSGAQQACVSLMSDCGIRSKDFVSAHIEFFLKVSGLREM